MSQSRTIRLVATPLRAELASGLTPIDFADCYQARLARTGVTALQVAYAMFEQPPAWVGALMSTRDAVVRLFGLKTAGAIARRPAASRVGIFPLISQSPTELVMGLDDKHLDFRIWLGLRRDGEATEVSMSTLIRHHGAGGRIYLFVVMPFHKLLSRLMLARALRLLAV